jgi:hypothetical protein
MGIINNQVRGLRSPGESLINSLQDTMVTGAQTKDRYIHLIETDFESVSLGIAPFDVL